MQLKGGAMSSGSQQLQSWGSRWGFVLAAIGMALGTGVMWRFPRIAAQYGGMPFLIVLILSIAVWVMPVLMIESVLGKSTRMGPVSAFISTLGKKYTWLGTCYAAISIFVTAYYLVVFGWVLRYLVYAFSGVIKPGLDTEALWTTFSTGAYTMVPWWLLGLLLCVGIILAGGIKAVEKLSKIAMPLWLLLIIGLAIRACTLPGGIKGLEYLFAPDWSQFGNPKMWLEAFTQGVWQTGNGLGLMLCYAIYMKKDEDISLNCTFIPWSVTASAIICGMAVIPSIFALSPDPQAALASGNTGLTFIHLTNLFAVLPGGQLIAIVFFLSLAIAGYTSAIAMVEVATRIIQDMGVRRTPALIYAAVVLAVLGLPSALDINFQGNQDWVWGIAILVNGLITAFVAIKMNPKKIWDEHIGPYSDLNIPFVMKFVYLMPVFFIVIFGMWMISAITDYPGEWMQWLPISEYPYTVGTILYQWGILAVIAIISNSYVARLFKIDLPAVNDS